MDSNPWRKPYHQPHPAACLRAIDEAAEYHTLDIFTLDEADFVYDEFGNVRRPAYRLHEETIQ